MLLTGEEILFQIGNFDKSCFIGAIYLKYMGTDKTGVRFKGRLPLYWRKDPDEITGPYLFHDCYLFTVVHYDYGHNTIWLNNIALEFSRRPVLFDNIDFNQTHLPITAGTYG